MQILEFRGLLFFCMRNRNRLWQNLTLQSTLQTPHHGTTRDIRRDNQAIPLKSYLIDEEMAKKGENCVREPMVHDTIKINISICTILGWYGVATACFVNVFGSGLSLSIWKSLRMHDGGVRPSISTNNLPLSHGKLQFPHSK